MIQQSTQSIINPGNGALRNGHDRRGHIQEYCQSLLHRLRWPGERAANAPRTLGITSCRQGEGVSTIAASLAAAAASWGDYRILLADANVAKPSAHESFGVPLYPGWANIHKDGDALAKHIQPTSIFNLSVLAAGILDEQNTSAGVALGSPGLVKELTDGFDLSVFDLPPMESTGDAAHLAALLDGVVLVVEAELSHRDDVRRACEQLTRFGARPLGVVLNKFRQSVPEWLARAL
ncbi:MAG: CpsD/CapB family tyrosine-protein kinase [Thermoguttaceae bacterium]|jgi:capsular exopolysaccharide synthesis family protein